ncbi:MAG: histone deacetylase [Marmoricola sp.]|jgi:hypothetical protein|nr:histone deacetylase [Marmoricola sp.]
MSDEPAARPLPTHGEVWYVSYGSNMSAVRLSAYLEGGVPPGGTRTNPGARDSRPPRHSVPVDLPGSLYFAGHSRQWGGGVAFYEHDARDAESGAPTAARAYLVTAQQFTDIAAQEMYRVPQAGDPLEQIVLGGIDGGVHTAGPGHYETLIEVGRLEGAPMLLFTAPHGVDHVEHTQPSAAYLAVLATGLEESRGWDRDRLSAYFQRVGVIEPAPPEREPPGAP